MEKRRSGKNLRRAQFLDAQAGKPLSHIDRLLKGLALDNTSAQAAGKGVTSTVGIVDLLLGKLQNGEFLDVLLALDSDDGWFGALGDDGDPLALLVFLGQVGELLGDLLDVGQLPVVRLGVGGGLGLVADDVVPVRGAGVERVLEELADEGGRQRQDEGLVAGGRLLAQLLDGGRADGEVVAADVVRLGVLDQLPDLGGLEVLDVVVVGGGEVGAHAPVVACDDDGAAAGGLLGVDAVLHAETGLLDGVVQDGGVLVVADAAQEDDAVGRQHVLRSAGGVLGGAAGDELGVEVVQQVLVDALVLLLGEDGVIGLEAVLLEEGFIAEGLDV